MARQDRPHRSLGRAFTSRTERAATDDAPASGRKTQRVAPIDTTIESWARARTVPPAEGFVTARLARERTKAERLLALEASPIGRRRSPHHVVPRALALSGLAGRAWRNALAITFARRTLALPSLPAAFEGFRVLHVSDPHFGADPALDDAIVAGVADTEHDLCVMTGDYRYRSFGPIDTAIAGLERLRDVLAAANVSGEAPLAVLGNHDSIEMVPPMEALGIRVLLNECATLRRDDASLHVAGVDDPRYYRLDDLPHALAARTPDAGVASDATTASGTSNEAAGETVDGAATILLAHSPERADAASAASCDAYLCGHTHGGQICLPGGRIVMRNARAPRERLSGAWRLGRMRGYTSPGLGVSIATARFHCPPELTLHTLRRANERSEGG